LYLASGKLITEKEKNMKPRVRIKIKKEIIMDVVMLLVLVATILFLAMII
jgi:hypothetical protein